jgi:hypothetical protein
MGLFQLFSLETLATVLTFQFLIPATIIAAAMLFAMDFLAKQEAAEKEVATVVGAVHKLNPVGTHSLKAPS